jgi:hypothetical protein
MGSYLTIHVRVGDDGPLILLRGREAWAALQLIAAGTKGVTPIDNPAPRWSAYVFDLRQLGVDIETIHEPQGGPFAGTHARYVLRSKLVVVEDVAEEAA